MNEPLNFKILGDTSQVLEISLEPGKTLIADGGALLYFDHEIKAEIRDTDEAERENGPEASYPENEEEIEDELPEALLPEEEPFEDFEEKDTEGNLLQKLWVATKKAVAKVARKKESEEEISPPEEFYPPDKEEPPSFEAEEPEEGFSWFITHFSNQSDFVRKIAFTTANSGIVVPIDLSQLIDQELIIQNGTFLCAWRGTRLEKFLDTGLSVSFAKEKLFKLDKLRGEGMVFLQAEGQVIQKVLDNDAIRISLFSLIAFESTLEVDPLSVISVQSMNYEDETQFVTLSGTGKYWLQTANIQQLVYRISPFVFENGGEEDTNDGGQGFKEPPPLTDALDDIFPDPEPHVD
ncbi:MAG: hypothetical protein OHK0053_03760 [Microscillaceae bacterium]